MPRVVSARIELPKRWGDYAKVIVDMGNGEDITALNYFHDEISFTADEVVGKTLDEIRELHYQKDRAYLRS